jgi:hypothetical protein
MIVSAVAINLHRLFDWWKGVPRSLTRVSPLASLAPEPALVAASWRA